MSQTPAEHVLQRTGKLAKKEGMKEIQIKRDMNEEESEELRVEAQKKKKKWKEHKNKQKDSPGKSWTLK